MENLSELSEKTSERIDQLAETWNVDRKKLLEEFKKIYMNAGNKGEEFFSDEEERQKYAVERLSVQVAIDREKFETDSKRNQNFEEKEDRSDINIGLYNRGGNRLNPLKYSTGKTQAEVIEEILEAFEKTDLVFLKGVVGSGKSVIGIRIALEFGGGTVSVPTKVLSHQYQDDYEDDKYFLKKTGEKAQIRVLKGRRNFICPYIDNKYPQSEYKSCQNRSLPCSRPLGREESRLDAVQKCPYWGFIFPTSSPLKNRSEHIGSYRSLSGRHSLLMSEGENCPYWNQFKSYLEADVNVMNSKKWEVEAMIGRLPLSDVTIVDEADAWLDGLSSRTSLNEKKIGRLINTLRDDGLGEEAGMVRSVWSDYEEGFEDPMPLVENLVEILEKIELGSNVFWQLKRILDFKDEIVAEEEEGGITYYIPDPEPVLSKLRDRVGGKWLFMSATIQDMEVLNQIYGIDPVIIEGEVKFPGRLVQRRIGSERAVSNRRWKKYSFRKLYERIRDQILKKAKRPCFVPVHATKYLPEGIDNLTEEDRKEINGVSFSTKMDRGSDLEEMKSVVLLKYPFPDLSDPLLQATKKRLGEKKFWMYYHDISEREFIQQIGRTLRSPNDEVEFWSPDARCHQKLAESWKGEIVREKMS